MTEHEEWLDRAESDIRFARIGMREKFYTHVCFLCQQTAEKALKGYLIFKARGYPRIHLLLDLLILCMQHEPHFQQFRPYCNVLEQYYTPSRYPGSGIPLPQEQEAWDALQMAAEILTFVKARISTQKC